MLNVLEQCLKRFHENKEIIIELKIQEHFNIPKLHAIMHYFNSIHTLGSMDGYNTESPERLHIDFAKGAYSASNKREYMEQMALWLQIHEAMWLRESYLIWIEDRLSVVAAEKNEENDEAAAEDHNGDDEVDVIDDQQHQQQLNVSTNKEFKWNLNYFLTMRPPYPQTTVNKIVLNFGAIDFVSVLSIFLR